MKPQLLVLCAVLTPSLARAQASRPLNVLWIMSDQHSVRATSAYQNGFGGLSEPLTPNIDTLAREGVRFDRAYCAQPQCVPSRVSFLTGLWPHDHGVRWNGIWSPPGLVTLAHVAREHGYATAVFGKHHMPWLAQEEPLENDMGFDEVLDLVDYVDHCAANGKPAWLSPGAFYTIDPDLPTELSDWTGYTFNTNEFHPAGYVTDQSLRFLDERFGPAGDQRPFFLMVSYYGPHNPLLPSGPNDPEDFAHAFAPFDQLQLPPNFGKPAESPRMQNLQDTYSSIAPPVWREILGYYYGLVHQVDFNVGRLLERVDDLGIADDTLVLYLSDHGEMGTEMGLWSKGAGNFEGVSRVPLMMRLPGVVPASTSSDALVSLLDLFPTITELAGFAIDDELRSRLAGRSLFDLLHPELETPWREELFVEFGTPWNALQRTRTVIGRDTKLDHDELGDVEQFYDLAADPFEELNRIDDPSRATEVERMRARLEAWWNDEEGHAPHYRIGSLTASGLPAEASSPTPVSVTYHLPRHLTLSWLPSTGATSQTLWFGRTGEPLVELAQLGAMVDTFLLDALAADATYVWRIDSTNVNGTTPGPLWGFRTAVGAERGAGIALEPSPAQGAKLVARQHDLRWTPGSRGASQDVWFGPVGALQRIATELSPRTAKLELETLDANVEYAWRIDTWDARARLTRGRTWRFRTRPGGLPRRVEGVAPAHLEFLREFPAGELRWTPATGAEGYDVFLGTEHPLPLVERTTELLHATGPLAPGTYFWRVDSVNEAGHRRGPELRFTILP